MSEFSRTDRDRLIHLDAIVAEHDRQLRNINGRLHAISSDLTKVKDNDLRHIQVDLYSIKGSVKTWGIVAATGLSTIGGLVVWALTST